MATDRDDGRQRFRRRRWRSRAGRAGPWLIAFTGVLVAGALGWLVLVSPVLGVHEVEVDGVETIGADRVRERADIASGAPLATLDADAISARVEELPRVAEATVHRSWPRGVTLRVDERTAVAVLEKDGALRGVDGDGVVFRRYGKPPDLPKISLQDVGEDRDVALEETARVLESLDGAIGKRVNRIEVGSVDSIELLLAGGDRVRWGSAEQSQRKARVLEALLEVPASVYDVTAPQHPATSR